MNVVKLKKYPILSCWIIIIVIITIVHVLQMSAHLERMFFLINQSKC